MKKIAFAAIIASIVAGGTASGADMAVKARPIPAPAPVLTWSGFYIGVNGGGVWNDTQDNIFPTGCFLTNPACGFGPVANPQRSDSVRLTGTGYTVGGQAGYNWQADRWVFGIEGDINYNSINDGSAINRPVAAPLAGNIIHAETDKLQWFGTLRGRIGVAVAPNFLLYGTGGLAFGGIKSASAVAFTATTDAYAGSIDDTRFGWTAGAGGEWLVTPNWSIKAEYLYIDLGKASYTQPCVTAVCAGFNPPPTYQTDLNIHQHVARVGLNYHFGGPVVAKY